MKLKVFSVYDAKVQDFGNPFFMHHEGEAIRGFTSVANDSSTKINKYPHDYSLFELGTYDTQLGRLESLSSPLLLTHAYSVIEQPKSLFTQPHSFSDNTRIIRTGLPTKKSSKKTSKKKAK